MGMEEETKFDGKRGVVLGDKEENIGFYKS